MVEKNTMGEFKKFFTCTPNNYALTHKETGNTKRIGKRIYYEITKLCTGCHKDPCICLSNDTRESE